MHKPLSVSMIVIGDEILNGRTSDLNGNWLAKFLFKMGIEFHSMRFVKDQKEEISKAVSEALLSSDIIITSGGIGPTLDDKTKIVLADYFQKQIAPSEDVKKIVEENYARFNRTWAPELNFYHHFPADFKGVANPLGLAPGLSYYDQHLNKLILSAPGVPREFVSMVEEEFLPMIKSIYKNRFMENFQTVIRTEGVPEEKIFNELCPQLWSDLEHFGKVSSLPHTLGIDIVISYHGSQEEHEKKMKNIRSLIEKTPLVKNVWQWGNKNINELLILEALEKNVTFSFAESCTGGLVSSKMTDIPGSSKVFWGSVVSYDNSIKENLLNVKSESLKNFGAVSALVAEEMAVGARDKLKTDFAVSISGIAGPGGGSDTKPVGTVAIGYATPKKQGAMIFNYPGDRLRLKDRFSDKAILVMLNLIRENS